MFDDEIDSLRTFDVDTQRSIYKVNDVRLLPAREFPTDEEARKIFRTRFRESVEGDPTRSRIYKDVSRGSTPAGIEYYLPLFFDATAFDHDSVEARAIEFLLDGGYLRKDDSILLTKGEIMGRAGSTNIMKILPVA